MDEGLDIVLGEVALKFISAWCEHGEEMIDVLSVGEEVGKCDERGGDVVVVIVGYLLTTSVVVDEMVELDIEDGGLDLI